MSGPPGAADKARPAEAETDPPHVASFVRMVERLISRPVTVHADANFELDLGLDSMERVELLLALEQRFGTRLPEDAAQRAFTVRQLAEAFHAADPKARPGEGGDSGWPTTLQQTSLSQGQQDLLRADRPLPAALLFAATRVVATILFRPRVRGLEHLPARGPFILSPNHQSYLDPFALVGVLPFRTVRQLFFVGATEYFESPTTAWLAGQLNIIPVDPDARLVPAMQAGAFGLRSGKVLVLFPEGERSIDGTVKSFKKGAGLLSEHLDVPIVPVAIDGMFEVWPRNRPVNWRLLLPWSGHHVRITIGKPLAPAERHRLRDVVDAMFHGPA